MKTETKLFIPLPADLKSEIAAIAVETERKLAVAKADRDAIQAEIDARENLKSELKDRIVVLTPALSTSDDAALKFAASSARLEAVGKELGAWQQKLSALPVVYLDHANPVIDKIYRLWRDAIEAYAASVLAEIHFPTHFLGPITDHIGVRRKTAQFFDAWNNVEASAEGIARLNAVLAIALNGRVSPELDVTENETAAS